MAACMAAKAPKLEPAAQTRPPSTFPLRMAQRVASITSMITRSPQRR